MYISLIHLSDILIYDSLVFHGRVHRASTTGKTRRRENVISDRESGGHYPLSRHGQYYRPWGHRARECDSCATVPMETHDRIRSPYPRHSDFFGTREGLSRAVPAVAQILTRWEVAESREFGERLCAGGRDFTVGEVPDYPFVIDGKRYSRNSHSQKLPWRWNIPHGKKSVDRRNWVAIHHRGNFRPIEGCARILWFAKFSILLGNSSKNWQRYCIWDVEKELEVVEISGDWISRHLLKNDVHRVQLKNHQGWD